MSPGLLALIVGKVSTAVKQPSRPRRPDGPDFSTRVSRYEQVSALLVALVIMVGFFAILLFLIWLTRYFKPQPRLSTVTPIQDFLGRGDHAQGYANDFEEPGVEELPDVQEPQLAETLEAMTDAISTQKASLESFQGTAAETGTGDGAGDIREAGPGGDGTLDIVPPWERWEINYTTSDIRAYAEQLDFFNIELGAIARNSPNVQYASNFSSKPVRRVGTREQEQRLYFVHPANDKLAGYTRSLLEKASIETQDHFVAQFYPNGTEAQLLAIEKKKMGRRSLALVRKTVFGVRKSGSSFEYFVVKQELKPGA